MGKNDRHKDVSHLTVLHDILNSILPPAEKAANRLADEGMAVVDAGQRQPESV